MPGIVIVGAGQAGASLAAKLRMSGYTGEVTLIGEEHVPPYQRPPLSKKYLLGEMELERLYLRPESFYAENDITLRTDCRVDSIDAADRKIVLGAETLEYEHLALTTGSVPRRLPPAIGGLLEGVHVVRTLRDIDRLAPEMVAGKRVLIVGGGYIGLEAAAVASKLGLDVVLVEMAERILQRVAAPETSDYFRTLHRSHGVDIREATGLERLTGEGRVSGAVLSDETEIAVDLVIVGVGISPATELAEAAGLTLDNGIAVDAMGRTSDPHIWSAGDCASFPWRGQRIRLESVQNAIDQAELVASNMLGAEAEYDPKIWFWSDQYDVKLQIAGLNTGFDRIVVRPGEKEGSASHWYFAGNALLAVDAMNDPRAYMVGKRLIDGGRSADPAALADPATDLKALMRG
ncbi:NAD(P)/FAD-dependent oxidoreductase [Aliiruegeria lutimaris]|uniref:3-phenylpropionate/trans-cinnamate dioxygenase ferredoxin reductase subunit n=1 Tax=Aliiruegeria lutimaris TaxID=571298 RepID=A0A1G9DFI5_9RHOB|nr:FAD-dependent oxidoreductase [Aliiruegeria lutimaris]SDK62613.1 3-phenylpropionate/trans-cinnamate dioxygenase ferredoxin reductase subunit [Aliiruegeria lutimaris]